MKRRVNRGVGGAIPFILMFGVTVISSAATITYNYDSLNRLASVTYDNGQSITYTYDSAGNRLTMTSQGLTLAPPSVNDEGRYVFDNTQLHARWSAYPSAYGSVGFLARLVKCSTTGAVPPFAGCQEELPPLSMGGALESTQTGLNLDDCTDVATNCPVYYFGVTGVHVIGLQSAEGGSDGIRVLDPTGDPDHDGHTNADEAAQRSNPLDGASLPRATTVRLVRGFNVINIPADLSELLNAEAPTAFQVLDVLGTTDQIDRIQKIGTNGVANEALFEGGSKTGDDFPVAPGDALIVYAAETRSVPFTSVRCPTWNLRPGANLVGTPCAPAGTTAYTLLQAIGDASVVSSIQRFNPTTGQFETAGYGSNGQPVGADFPIVGEEGYIVTMKEDRLGFRP